MNSESSALLTDLYQLTMLKGYYDQRMNETAVFEFYIRRLPANRNFLLTAGLEQALQFVEGFRFTEEELAWLIEHQALTHDFAAFLRDLRFTGSIDAMPEGTIFFENEPVLRVTAPMPVAQILETRLINLLQFQIMIATKAARCLLAAPGKTMIDFGMRRAHGAEAAMLAARASYVAGFAGTSNVLAGKRFGIPISGTVAHSFIQAHSDEALAFEHFAESNPQNAVFLLDTFDTLTGARKVVELAPRLQRKGIAIRGVRLDSGHFGLLARQVRAILNEGGLKDVRILASGNLDEEELQKLATAPIDGFGIGTRLTTAADAPYLECVYKLIEYAGRPTRKFSEGKATWPGRKQVYRHFAANNMMAGDTLALNEETVSGKPLLVPVMREGRRISQPESLEAIRDRATSAIEMLPTELRTLTSTAHYHVKISPGLRDLSAALQARQFGSKCRPAD